MSPVSNSKCHNCSRKNHSSCTYIHTSLVDKFHSSPRESFFEGGHSVFPLKTEHSLQFLGLLSFYTPRREPPSRGVRNLSEPPQGPCGLDFSFVFSPPTPVSITLTITNQIIKASSRKFGRLCPPGSFYSRSRRGEH